MLRISKLADYSIVVAKLLAESEHQHYSATTVARLTFLPLPTVSKVLRVLCDAAIVVSKEGRSGGYQLARAANHISLLDIIESMDGEFAMTDCNKTEGPCVYAESCQLQSSWQVINKVIAQVLGQLTLSDMMGMLAQDTVPISTKLNNLIRVPVEGMDSHE